MTDQMHPHEAQLMISVLGKVGLDSKPLLDICSKKIIGILFFYLDTEMYFDCISIDVIVEKSKIPLLFYKYINI